MTNLLKQRVWRRVTLILIIIMLTIGPMIFRELRADVAVNQASSLAFAGPIFEPWGPVDPPSP